VTILKIVNAANSNHFFTIIHKHLTVTRIWYLDDVPFVPYHNCQRAIGGQSFGAYYVWCSFNRCSLWSKILVVVILNFSSLSFRITDEATRCSPSCFYYYFI